MKQRALPAVGLLCLFATGCIQTEQVFTLNPDGSGKVAITLVTPLNPMEGIMGGLAGPGKKRPSIAEKKRVFLEQTLAKTRGVDAWKDVSAEFTPDGRIKFQGTAYFKNLQQLNVEGALGNTPVRLVKELNGSLRLAFASDKLGNANLPVGGAGTDQRDPRKLADKELDEFILDKRIEYQTVKGILTAVLTDMKVKCVFRLPGDVGNVKGFKTEGKQTVILTMEGNTILKAANDFMAKDNAFFRKQLREGGRMDVFGDPRGLDALGLDFENATASVAKPGAAQFDYAKEAAAARAAYPALRKRLGLGEEPKIPDFKNFQPPPEKKPVPPPQ
jgi:hypothetical protein